MVTQAPRPIGQTTITRHTAPVRIHGPIVNVSTAPQRINNATTISQIRPGTTTIVQTNMQQNIPALQPVSAPMTGFAPGGAQVSCTVIICGPKYDLNSKISKIYRFDRLLWLCLERQLGYKFDKLLQLL